MPACRNRRHSSSESPLTWLHRLLRFAHPRPGSQYSLHHHSGYPGLQSKEDCRWQHGCPSCSVALLAYCFRGTLPHWEFPCPPSSGKCRSKQCPQMGCIPHPSDHEKPLQCWWQQCSRPARQSRWHVARSCTCKPSPWAWWAHSEAGEPWRCQFQWRGRWHEPPYRSGQHRTPSSVLGRHCG